MKTPSKKFVIFIAGAMLIIGLIADYQAYQTDKDIAEFADKAFN